MIRKENIYIADDFTFAYYYGRNALKEASNFWLKSQQKNKDDWQKTSKTSNLHPL